MVTTVLDFNYDASSLGAYIVDALGSLGSLWVIPAGLIIGSAILIFSFRLINQMKDKINCEGEREEKYKTFKERAKVLHNNRRLDHAKEMGRQRNETSAFESIKKGRYRARERKMFGGMYGDLESSDIPERIHRQYKRNYTGDLNLYEYTAMMDHKRR